MPRIAEDAPDDAMLEGELPVRPEDLPLLASRLGLTRDQTIVNIDRYGNTSAASIPLALDDCVQDGRLKKGARCPTLGA